MCGSVLAICKCSSHIISFDLTNYANTDTNYLLDLDSKLETLPLPRDGIDYIIHFNNPKDRFFERIGNWFRIWRQREHDENSGEWRWSPNPEIKLPHELSGNISVFDTFIHSRSNCALIYDYFPPVVTGNTPTTAAEVQMPTINLLF